MAAKVIKVNHKFPLKKYAGFIESHPDAAQAASSADPEGGTWNVIMSTDDNPMSLLISDNDLLIVHQGSTTYESLFLPNSKEWIRGFVKGDSILLICKFTESRQKRFRVQFDSFCGMTGVQQCRACVDVLGKHFPFRDPLEIAVPSPQPIDVDEMYNQRFESQETLRTLVKACLRDPTFPHFVRQVEEAMDAVLNSTDTDGPSTSQMHL